MNSEALIEFKGELENIATYNTEPISQEEFRKFFRNLKSYTTKNNIDMPEIFRYTGSTLDFRRKMQSYGGYEERRQEIDNAIYDLCDKIDKIDYGQDNQAKRGVDRKEVIKLLKTKRELQTKYGVVKFNAFNIKEGGNSIVIFGDFQNEKVAVKILISDSSSKINRFLCEFANVIIKLADLRNISKLYFYDTVIIGMYMLDIIVMKQYSDTLKYDENYTEEEIINIFKQILDCMEEVHKRGIIHRDIKPQNILLDNNSNIVITDFGIAYYNPEIFDITGHTTSGERLANFDFSAPEQRNSREKPQITMDIYSIGQIIQWLVFGQPHKGTNRRKLTEKYNTKRMKLLDEIVEKCLDNNPDNRYKDIQSIKEIIANYNAKAKGKTDSTVKENIQVSTQEIKEKLEDILGNICGTDKKWKKFEILERITEKDTIQFLDNLKINLNKVQFFNTVPISKFLQINTYNNELVDKRYFIELQKLYEEIKNTLKELLPSVIEYIKDSINNNYNELPF